MARSDRIPVRVYIDPDVYPGIESRADAMGIRASSVVSMIICRVMADADLMQVVFAPLLTGSCPKLADFANPRHSRQKQTGSPDLAEVPESGEERPHSSISPSVHSSISPHIHTPRAADAAEPEPEPDPEKRPKTPAWRGPYSDDFLAWYALYPRKAAKRAGFRAWLQACKRTDLKTLMASVEAFADQLRAEGRPRDKTPHPATWLNGDCWEDEAPSELTAPVWQHAGESREVVEALDLLGFPDPYLRGSAANASETLRDMAQHARGRPLSKGQIEYAAKLARTMRPRSQNGVGLDSEQRRIADAVDLLERMGRNDRQGDKHTRPSNKATRGGDPVPVSDLVQDLG